MPHFRDSKLRLLFTIFAFFVFTAITPPAHAQAPKKILNEKDLVRFIESYPNMAKEFEAAGTVFEGLDDPAAVDSYVQGMKADSRARAILKKYGWADNFYAELAAIMYGYVVVLFEKESVGFTAKLDETYAMIDKSTDLSPAGQAQLRAQLDAAMKEVLGLRALFIAAVHPDDVELVRRHLGGLEPIFAAP